MSLLWHCSDNYNTIRFYHSCDVVLTIIIQFVFVSLWRCSDNYNTIRFLSLLWRCSDNYDTIRFFHSCDVVLTITTQFVFVTFVTFFWQLQHNSFCHSCDVVLPIIIQFCLSLLWRCSDNYNTILFFTLVTLF